MSREEWTPKYVVDADHSGLELVPTPGLEPTHDAWLDHHQKGLYNPPRWSAAPEVADPPSEAPSEPRQRILGLSVRAFWLMIVALVVILAAAIGGGVGGGLAARNRADSSSSTAPSNVAESVTTSAPAPASASASATGMTGKTTTTPPSSTGTTTTTTATVNSNPAAPTDGGCPGISGSEIEAVDSSGAPILLGNNGPAQQFKRFCNTNYPAGAANGNPGVVDLAKMYQPSLETCIAACASYNNQMLVKANGGGSNGLCTAVSIVKLPGEFCYLKNANGTDNTFGYPTSYSSAVLLTSLTNVQSSN